MPAAHGKLLLITATVGGWPAHYQSARSVSYQQHDEIVQACFSETDLKAVPGHEDDGIGWPSPTENRCSFFDFDSGALLAVVTTLENDPLTLRVDGKARIVHIESATCGGAVSLDGAARYLPPPP